MVCNNQSQILYPEKRDHWVCHRDMHLIRIKQKQNHLLKKVPAKTEVVISKMPGIIPLNTPSRIRRIKRQKSLFSRQNTLPIRTRMATSYLPIQTHPGLSSLQKK